MHDGPGARGRGDPAVRAYPPPSPATRCLAAVRGVGLGGRLAARGRTAESVVSRNTLFGAHAVVPADDPAMASTVVADTFLRFKGLERPAVIVTDLGWQGRQQPGVRMHIALTRALVAARIVAAPG